MTLSDCIGKYVTLYTIGGHTRTGKLVSVDAHTIVFESYGQKTIRCGDDGTMNVTRTWTEVLFWAALEGFSVEVTA